MYKRLVIVGVLIIVILGFLKITGFFQESILSSQEKGVLDELLFSELNEKDMELIDLKQEMAEKFPAVDKMFKISADGEEYYGFVVNPVGYRSPINTMVVIDAKNDEVQAIKVMQQDETPGWGEWLTEKWFLDRFKGKKVDKYLERVILEAEEPNDIIQITSATVSSQAVINGVNAAMGIYRELVLGEKADPVPLEVQEHFPENDKG